MLSTRSSLALVLFVVGCGADAYDPAQGGPIAPGGGDPTPGTAEPSPSTPPADAPSAPSAPPRRTGPPAPKLVTVLQGQSNAVFLQDGNGGYWNVYAPLVKDLTGIPEHDAQAVRSDFTTAEKGYTLASGTPTYSFADDHDQLWLDAKAAGAKADDPSTWPVGTHGKAFQNHLAANVAGKAPDGVPVVVLRFHSEYDSKKQGDEAKVYGAANRRFVSLVREWIGKPAAEVPVFLGMPGYWMNTRPEALDAIRDAWRTDIADANANCHWMFGNAYDGADRGDGSHMDEATTRRAAGRAALAVSRWLFDNGYAHRDLSWLPRLGPRFVAVRRVAGMPNAIDAVVAHDKGKDLVMPSMPSLDPVEVTSAGERIDAVAVAKISPTVLRFTLDRAIASDDAKVTFDYALWPGYYGAGRLVADDWSAARDAPPGTNVTPELASVSLPIRRLDRPLVLGAPAVADPASP